MILQKLQQRLSSYFFKLRRVEMLSGVELLSIAQSDKLLKPQGLSIVSQTLCEDLCLLAMGSEVKNRYDVEASIAFELSKRLPWYLKLIPGAENFARTRLTQQHMREWFILEMLQSLKLPGVSHKARYVSAAILYFVAKASIYSMDIPLPEVREWLSRVSSLAQSISEQEQVLLEALPEDQRMAELPEMLAEQFEKEKVDAELFFAGEQFRAPYVIGKAVRKLKLRRDSQTDSHLGELERLLSHPGRAIILHTSRQLEQFQAFVLEKLKEFQPDPSGDELRMRPLVETSEIRSARTGSLAMVALHPILFWRRVVNREMDVREYGFIEEERPRAHLLIDKSPSMLFFGKLFKAGGVLFNRLLKTIDDSAEVTFQLFDEQVYRKVNVEGPYEAQQVMGMVRMSNFVGSGTNINKVLRVSIAGIKKLPQRKSPDHLILVSDGCADVDVLESECANIKLHCFLLGGSSAELRTLCHATGGVYQEC